MWLLSHKQTNVLIKMHEQKDNHVKLFYYNVNNTYVMVCLFNTILENSLRELPHLFKD